MRRIIEARGTPVYDAEGEQMGAVEVVFYDRNTGEPEWVAIGTGVFGRKRVLVPLRSARLTGHGLHVPYSKDHVKKSPDIKSDEISEATERQLHAHYQLRTRTPAGGRGKAARKWQHSVKRPVEPPRRLRKWVETEPVDVDVELQRETAGVRREHIDQPVRDAELKNAGL